VRRVIVTGGLLALWLVSSTVRAEDMTWLTEFSHAKQLAATNKVQILADFSGSDWCGWCIKLDKEVFSTQAFKDYARTNLVLLLVDFPQRKDQAPKQIEQNKAMAKKYGVQGFPTVILMDPTGKELARTGYEPGGAVKYVEHLKTLLQEAKPPAVK
jgi:protein disulfide-isomerase